MTIENCIFPYNFFYTPFENYFDNIMNKIQVSHYTGRFLSFPYLAQPQTLLGVDLSPLVKITGRVKIRRYKQA